RLFVAINFPETLRQGLWSATESLRSGALPVRWVKPEAMHLTLKFLGDLAAERQDELAGALRRAAASSRAVTVTVADFGAFPDPRRPRVVWAGVSPEPALELLQHQVEQEFGPLGFPPEGRPFRPHLTLGRAERGGPAVHFRDLEGLLGRLTFEQTVTVSSVELMRSVPTHTGADYQPVASGRLS
ncbi:MAG TPA: RNA 2',3'-cyclic phosphodiesterase, partial [Gemmatimonadales bacterium]|nr:RNA 2',3'-cyclic phosphodiesterase [Gemmatimonadales bacterium]